MFIKYLVSRRGLLATLVIGLAGFVALPAMAKGKTIVMKFHHDLPKDSAQHAAALKFKAAVEARTGGEIEVKIFPSNALGNDVEATQQMQLGAIQGGLIPTAKLSSFDPAMQLIDLPFLFPSPKVAHEVLDSAAGKKLLKTLDKVGLKGLTFWESGFKQFTCDHPVKSPADFKGYKVRVMQSPIIIDQFKALGANPVPIAFTETYNALQQKVVNCEENPLVSITKMKFYEVGPDISLTRHAITIRPLVFSGKTFRKLPVALQKAIVKAGREAGAFGRKAESHEDAAMLAAMEKKGWLKTYKFRERDKLLALAAPVRKAFAAEVGASDFLNGVDAGQQRDPVARCILAPLEGPGRRRKNAGPGEPGTRSAPQRAVRETPR